MSDSARLSAHGLVKHFGQTRALDGVSFDVQAGELHALCGENGAGKSTLIKVVSGIYPRGSFEGEVRVDGVVQAFRGVRDAERAGVVVIHQELALVPALSAADNIFLGQEPTRLGLLDRARMLEESRTLLARLGASIDVAAPVATLGVGQAQLVEIARALRKRARVLILDEPTAALSEREASALFVVLGELLRAGVALVYVSHRLPEVFALSNRITVLRDGQSVSTRDTSDTSEAEVVRSMVGRALTSVFAARGDSVEAPTKEPSQQALLSVRGLSAARPASALTLHDLSFEVHAGEVLGIGGLLGAGRSELLLHLFGAWGERLGGQVELLGAPLDRPSPRQCIARGLALVSEDRKEQGLVLEQTVGFNLSLSHLRAFSRTGWVRAAEERRAQAKLAAQVQLRPARLDLTVGALSGGNQQKVVLGRALMSAPRVLLLDEPTRGVDVGAKGEIYALIAEQCRAGMAVVLVTSELPELLGLADRIVMLVQGRIGGRFTRAEATQERLMAAALHHSLDGQSPQTPENA
ncbi:MAG: D-xylose transporter ATP-binding protein [Myxococcaceae bacterium]|nr:D-xylose transporter ATP-binding protein [Myxococcaceae bacterium]